MVNVERLSLVFLKGKTFEHHNFPDERKLLSTLKLRQSGLVVARASADFQDSSKEINVLTEIRYVMMNI